MEALFLLCSIASTLVTSSVLSFILAVRSLPLLLSRALFRSSVPVSPNQEATADVRIYEGRVRHVRSKPVHHAFEYPVRYALFNLDRTAQPSSLSADRAREVAASSGPVLFLTIPASVGYEQNPLSVYYCYDTAPEQEEPRLKMCIAEVTNTPWGERVLFVFTPGSDLVAKPLHVSPFMDMLGNWNIHADTPGEDLSLAISVQHPMLGNYFIATLRAKRVYSSSSSLTLALYFWLMPHKVAVWIYWQAFKLWWKGVSFLGHPKYMNPMYRDDALLRDHELRCSLKIGQSRNCSNHTTDGANGDHRWCVWEDAKWPWS